jgi:hypothetical protein
LANDLDCPNCGGTCGWVSIPNPNAGQEGQPDFVWTPFSTCAFGCMCDYGNSPAEGQEGGEIVLPCYNP